jgi:glutamate formiminotransferase
MPPQTIECVPNFSEGRDAQKIDPIAARIADVPGVLLLDRHSDADHNRSVLTFAGAPEAVAEAAFRGVERAVESLDLSRHRGAHPRIGAADIVPFVPMEGTTLAECAALAVRVGERIWNRLNVPVYLYGAAARRPERASLVNIRRGQFEALLAEMAKTPERAPDIGLPACHPTAGAVAIGARGFLIACNVNLAVPDLAAARRIARAVRSSSGGLPEVKAMGVMLASRNLAQVSMNLTNFEVTPIHVAVEAVRREAGRQGVAIAETEIVGLIPSKAFEISSECLRREGFGPGIVLEDRIARTVSRH